MEDANSLVEPQRGNEKNKQPLPVPLWLEISNTLTPTITTTTFVRKDEHYPPSSSPGPRPENAQPTLMTDNQVSAQNIHHTHTHSHCPRENRYHEPNWHNVRLVELKWDSSTGVIVNIYGLKLHFLWCIKCQGANALNSNDFFVPYTAVWVVSGN